MNPTDPTTVSANADSASTAIAAAQTDQPDSAVVAGATAGGPPQDTQ